MTDHSDSDSSGLSDGWALVNTQGELEDRESDSTSSSIEVLDRKPEDQLDPQDATSQSDSAECIELEQLMKEADVAAASSTAEAGQGDCGLSETGETVIAPVSTAHHLFDLSPPSAPEEPSGASYLRRGSTGEEEAKARTVLTQPSPERASHTDQTSHPDRVSVTDRPSHADQACHTDEASHADQACQTDRASPLLSERRLSLSSLWSVSSKSSSGSSSGSSADTSSGSDASSVGSTDDTDQGGHGSSSDADTDTDSEFVCLETEASSSSCAQSLEEPVSRSGVKARSTGSRSSVGSEFLFLPGTEDFAQLSINTSLESLPPAASQQATQDHQQQQQQQPQALASQESPSPEEQDPPAVPFNQQVFPGEEELVEAASSTLQDLQPGLQSQRDGTVLPPRDTLHSQDPIAEDDNVPAAAVVEPEHVWNHRSILNIKHWLSGHLDLMLGVLLMLMLAFVLGHWLGVTLGQSKLLDTQLTHMKQLRQARDDHRQCMSQRQVIQQQAHTALERERRLHQETVTEIQGKRAERQKEAHHPQGKPRAATGHATAGQERRKPVTGASEEHSTFNKENRRDDRQRADSLRHLYFSMRDEREIGMNASSYLDYLTRSVNLSAVKNRLRGYWDASMNWTEGTEGVSTLLGSGLSRLQKGVAKTVPVVWKGVSSTLSYTYNALRGTLHQRNNNNNADGKENEKYGQKYYGKEDKKYRQKYASDLMEDEENDEEAYVEDEEELEEKSEYDYDWGVNREEDDEEVSEANHAWTEGENEYVDMDRFDHARKKYSKKSEREDETHSRNRHQKKWSGIMNKFLKKAQKTFSRLGSRLRNWCKVKHTCPFWSENSAFSRVAAQVKNSVNKFSSRLKKRAERWLGKYHKEQTVDENDEGIYIVEDEEEFEEKSESDWGVNEEENHEEVNEGHHAWTEEENEYVETDGFGHTRKEYNKKSETEEEPYRSNRHRKKGSGVMNKFLKKTQKALSRLGHRLRKTWHKVKPTSWPLWSENSALGRIAAQVKNRVNKFSSKLQKKADRWFRKHSKERKDTEEFHKHATKGTHAGSGENVKKSDHLYDKTQHAMPDELHKTGGNEQQSDKSDEEGKIKHRPDSDRSTEGMSDNLTKEGRKEGMPNEAGKEKESEHSNKLDKKGKNGRSNNQSKENRQFDKVSKNKKEGGSEKLSGNSAKEERSDPQNKAKKKGSDKMANAEDKSAQSGRSSQKEQTRKNIRRSEKPREEQDETWEMKLDSNHFEQHEDNSNKDRVQAQNRRERPQHQKEKREHGTKSSSRASRRNRMLAMGRAKFRLQSQFQALFSKVGSMDREAFRDWSRRDLSKMAEEVLTVAEQYNDNLDLGLPVSGSLWLGCQHAFWVAAASHGVRYEPAQNCWQFLAPWQLDMLEEEGAEESSTMEWTQEDAEEMSGEDWNSRTDTDHGDMEEDADISIDEYAFADDCHVYSDTNEDSGSDVSSGGDDDLSDDGHVYSDDDGSADNTIQHHHLPKGQREGDEDANTLFQPAQSEADAQQQPSRETSQPWYTHRAQGRNSLRSEDHKADWMFERAMEREEARQQEHAADWVFERAAERDASRHKKGEDSQGRRVQKVMEENRKQKVSAAEGNQDRRKQSRYRGR